MTTHIVQSQECGEFKTKYGTPAIRVGNVQYTIHKIPLLGYKYAYCPKVNPFEIQWPELLDSLNQNKCFAILTAILSTYALIPYSLSIFFNSVCGSLVSLSLKSWGAS